MPDGVHRFFITLEKPSQDGRDPGAVSEGYYRVENGVVIMTDDTGEPIRSAGKEWHAAAKPGQERRVAGELARAIRSHYGRDKPNTFDRVIRYRPLSVV